MTPIVEIDDDHYIFDPDDLDMFVDDLAEAGEPTLLFVLCEREAWRTMDAQDIAESVECDDIDIDLPDGVEDAIEAANKILRENPPNVWNRKYPLVAVDVSAYLPTPNRKAADE